MSALPERRIGRLLLAALLAACAAVGVRLAYQSRLAPTAAEDSAGAWHAWDPDTLYHARRVAQALDHGGVAGRDERLGWPEFQELGGGPVPWPPVYDALLAASARPFVPDDDRAPGFVERWVSTAPMFCAAFTAALVALAVGRMAGVAAALAAGLLQALAFASVRYSYWGMGDHHAAVTAMTACLALGLGRALEPERLQSVPGSLRRGVLLGLLVAALIGTWVAAVVQVGALSLLLQLRLGVARERRAGIAALGLGLHLVGALCLVPLALTSPWPAGELLALSWVHPGLLILGAVPLAILARTRCLGLLLGVQAALLAAFFGGLPLPGLLGEWAVSARAWAGGSDSFMGSIQESQPLLGFGQWSRWLGYGIWLLPAAWCAALWASLRGRVALAPWVALAIPLGLMALQQRRFGEALVPVLAVLVTWSLAAVMGRVRERGRGLAGAMLVLCALGSHPSSLLGCVRGYQRGLAPARTPELERARGIADLLQRSRNLWPGALLGQWDLGHAVEWFAQRPSVATNFGSYLSEAGFLAPWKFFLTTDEEQAAQQLAELEVELVLVTSRFAHNLESMVRAVHPEQQQAWLWGADGEAPLWHAALGGRLLGIGGQQPGDGLGFLRQVLVAAPEFKDRGSSSALAGLELPPVARLYQRVRGALVETRLEPGESLRISLRMEFPGEALFWSAEAAAGDDGWARIRVPYATDLPAGEGRLAGAMRWRVTAAGKVSRDGELHVTEAAVRAGDRVSVP
ncbi:MAG: asparagine N-glycosylation enzyme membrane subunit Stt3 [Planctomycetota bacterium]|jgi:asparagine N-glycosylation enzyme membrane subunit Stt3